MCHACFASEAKIRGGGGRRLRAACGSRSIKSSNENAAEWTKLGNFLLHIWQNRFGISHPQSTCEKFPDENIPGCQDSLIQMKNYRLRFQINLEGFRRWNACRRIRLGARLICDVAPGADRVREFNHASIPHPTIQLL